MTLLTPALKARIGERAVYTAPEEIGRAAGRYFAVATGDDNPLYLAGTVVPPTWIFETGQYTGLSRDADGYCGHTWHLDVPGTRLVRGGHRYRWTRDVRPADVVTATWELVDMAERTTRAGAAMLVVTSACRYTDATGAPIAEQTEDLIFVELS